MARELRRTRPGLPVIFMTGYSGLERQAKEEGAVAVLIKPVNFDELFAIIDRFC